MYDHNKIAKKVNSTIEQEKTANKKALSLAEKMLLYGTVGVGIGAGAPATLYGIGKGIKYLQRGSVNRDFNAVVKEDPELKGLKREDGVGAKSLYKVLHRTAPYVAKEPLVASKVLRNMMEIPRITPQTFVDVLKLEKMYQDTEMPFFNQSGGNMGIKPGDVLK